MKSDVLLSPRSIVSRNPDVAEAELDGEVMALNADNGTCYGFNRTASRVWKILLQPASPSEVCGRLVAEYDIDEETCKRQVMDLLEVLRGEGLVEVRPEAPYEVCRE